MSMACPQCGKAFSGMDYCPEHGLELVRQAADPPMLPSAQSNVTTPAPTAVSAEPNVEVATAAETEKEAQKAVARQAKLARFLQRNNVRIADAETPPEPTATSSAKPVMAAVTEGGESASPLPPELRAQGWQVSGKQRIGMPMTIWPVEQQVDGEIRGGAEFHRFHNQALTPVHIYKRLQKTLVPRLLRVLGQGTADVLGSNADYEVIASASESVTPLTQWLVTSTASESRAMQLLPALNALLEGLAKGGVRPLVLEPEMLVRNAQGEVWLATAAALEDVREAARAHPEYARSPLLSKRWAAPETTEQTMLKGNAVVFSVGQLLATCVWEQPCQLAELRTGAVNFRGIANAQLARVLMGCLWPHAAERWSVADLARACAPHESEPLPAAPPWNMLAPGAAAEAFGLAGASYWRLEELLKAAALPDHWQEAISRLEALLTWAEGTAWAGQARLLRAELADGHSADWVLIRLRRLVSPDAPLIWRGVDLSDEQAETSLIALAQQALCGEGQADATKLRELFEADLRGAFTAGKRIN